VVLRADEKYNLLNNVRTELYITVLMRQGSTAKNWEDPAITRV
jgi:hypothetical protein